MHLQIIPHFDLCDIIVHRHRRRRAGGGHLPPKFGKNISQAYIM